MLTQAHARIIEDRGLDLELVTHYGVKSSEARGANWIEIPYVESGNVVNVKFRTIAGEKQFSQQSGARKTFWNQDVLTDPTLANEPLIITEGEFDALAAIQCGFIKTISVPDGAPATEVTSEDSRKYSYLIPVLALIKDCAEIIICADSDEAGANLLNDLAVRIGHVRCKWVKYPKGCKDLNDALRRYGPNGVHETIRRAQWYGVEGVYEYNDLPPATDRPVFPLKMPVMDNHYRPRLGDFCVVTGVPSHGKSSWLNEVAGRLAINYGWRTAFASFEQEPQTDHRRNLRTYYSRKRPVFQSSQEIAQADQWIQNHFVFIVPGLDDDVTLEWVLERCAAAVVRHGVNCIIIDPWNEMDHIRPKDMSLTEYVGFAIKEFKAFARKYKIHLIVAAHPAKMKVSEKGAFSIPTLYEISDSAHWYNKADVGIVVWRGEVSGAPGTIVRIAKSKYHDQIGTPGDVQMLFSIEDNHYVPCDTENSYEAD